MDGTKLTIELQGALTEYRTRQARDSGRMRVVQAWCCEELAARGIADVEVEVRCSGAYRAKNWDVALVENGEVTLAISTKTLVSNHGGSIPNRIDDMIGEAANLHRLHPNAVLGYLAFMHIEDESAAFKKRMASSADPTGLVKVNRAAAKVWYDRWVQAVTAASGRQTSTDPCETWEAASVQLIDLDDPVHPLAARPLDTDAFFDRLVLVYRQRFG